MVISQAWKNLWSRRCIMNWGIVWIFVMSPTLSLAEVQDDLGILRKDIQEMKKDVAEIKTLLQEALRKPPKAKTTATVSVKGQPTLGRSDAPVTIVEFSDYQCPFCKRFATQVFPLLKRDYIESGKVRYVFRDFPLTQIHPQAAKAHEGAHCAGEQDRYWAMHALLFQNQHDLSVPALSRYAQRIGIDEERFAQCLESGRYGVAIQTAIREGTQADVRGTPSFIVGKSGSGNTVTGTFIRGAQPLSTFQQVIEAVYKGAIPSEE